MKYLKKFEKYKVADIVDIAEEIASDLLPKLKKLRKENGVFTVRDFDDYMKKRKSSSLLTDQVMSYLVDMGFDFDTEEYNEYSGFENNSYKSNK